MEDNSDFAKINIIPIVDIMLVLLAIVLISANFAVRGILPIDVPKLAETSSEKKLEKPLLLEIDPTGQLALNRQSLQKEVLYDALVSYDPQRQVLILADKSSELQFFVEAVGTLRKAGFNNINIQTK